MSYKNMKQDFLRIGVSMYLLKRGVIVYQHPYASTPAPLNKKVDMTRYSDHGAKNPTSAMRRYCRLRDGHNSKETMPFRQTHFIFSAPARVSHLMSK